MPYGVNLKSRFHIDICFVFLCRAIVVTVLESCWRWAVKKRLSEWCQTCSNYKEGKCNSFTSFKPKYVLDGLIKQDAALSQGGPRDAAVNLDKYQIL